MTTSQKAEAPLAWCQRMMDNAKDGNEAMNYFNLKKRWVGVLKEAHKLRQKGK